MDLRILGHAPSTQELADGLMVAAEVLEQDTVYAYDGRFHLLVDSNYSIALSADSADRIRVEACKLSCPGAPSWVFAGRHDRLKQVITRTLNEVLELA